MKSLIQNSQEGLSSNRRRRRHAVLAKVGLLLATACGPDPRSAEAQADVVAYAMESVYALKRLGACSVELKAQEDMEEYRQGKGDIPDTYPFPSPRDYRVAADLAQHNEVPCEPIDPSMPFFEMTVRSTSVRVTPQAVVQFSVPNACEQYQADALRLQTDQPPVSNREEFEHRVGVQERMIAAAGLSC